MPAFERKCEYVLLSYILCISLSWGEILWCNVARLCKVTLCHRSEKIAEFSLGKRPIFTHTKQANSYFTGKKIEEKV